MDIIDTSGLRLLHQWVLRLLSSVVWKQLSSSLVIRPFNLHQNVNNLLITSACFMITIKTGYSNPTKQASNTDSCVLNNHQVYKPPWPVESVFVPLYLE